MHFPTRNHFLDFGKIVGSRSIARNNAGNRLTHPIARQGRSFAHVACHLLSISTVGKDSGHVELRNRPLVFVADFTKVVEGLFRVDTSLFDKFLAQYVALLFAGINAWVEEVEEFKQERQAFACTAGKIHREPDIKESLTNRVKARTFVLPVLAGTQVVGVRETFEQGRSLLLAHAHLRSYGSWGFFLVAHGRQTFQQRALAGRQIVQPALIERRDPVEQ